MPDDLHHDAGVFPEGKQQAHTGVPQGVQRNGPDGEVLTQLDPHPRQVPRLQWCPPGGAEHVADRTPRLARAVPMGFLQVPVMLREGVQAP